MNSNIDDPIEEELSSLPIEPPFPSMDAGDPESSTSPSELFSTLTNVSNSGTSSTGGLGKDVYKCLLCGKHFGRLDHVKRHCRSREFCVALTRRNGQLSV